MSKIKITTIHNYYNLLKLVEYDKNKIKDIEHYNVYCDIITGDLHTSHEAVM